MVIHTMKSLFLALINLVLVSKTVDTVKERDLCTEQGKYGKQKAAYNLAFIST